MNRAVLLAVLLALPVAPAAQVQVPPREPAPAWPPALGPRAISVTGEGKVAVRPDLAVVDAGVESTGKDLGKVTADAAAQQKRLLQALAQAGIAEKDVQTTRHDVTVNRPWKDGSPGPITGYTVVDEVRVKVRDVSRLGAVLDRVVAAGANTLRGLSFEKEDPAPQRREALARAVGDARAKAEAIAKAAGVGLGDVLSVDEAAAAPRPIPMMRAVAREGGEAPVSPGEVEVSGQVEVTFAIR
ncbi:SIMPL domain-containing protein [Anaeromyxobacter oryzae]|uniref:DUF541 domain-containing protein n=1 Tax=Anaeromyxobacter oryzae TaxID=2918170 RepID=A0ABM7WNN2_9BACT|nr:SIMPL domain-containing protein [Anaeromyxobacter oryzae]BDG01060.1 hypothetical protein AMOR_00560 [Anaeromyxobacter oryzae]